MTKQKLYRIRQTFTYPPTGRVYIENETDPLVDWHPADIKAGIPSLLEVVHQFIETIKDGEEPPVITEEVPDVKNQRT